jgi:hypothetical protein
VPILYWGGEGEGEGLRVGCGVGSTGVVGVCRGCCAGSDLLYYPGFVYLYCPGCMSPFF